MCLQRNITTTMPESQALGDRSEISEGERDESIMTKGIAFVGGLAALNLDYWGKSP